MLLTRELRKFYSLLNGPFKNTISNQHLRSPRTVFYNKTIFCLSLNVLNIKLELGWNFHKIFLKFYFFIFSISLFHFILFIWLGLTLTINVNNLHKSTFLIFWSFRVYWKGWYYHLSISRHWSLSIPPGNIRKPKVFWYFHGVSKETRGMKWFNNEDRKVF